jgi:muramoyltetrapeptide carboxypeptidase
MYQLMRSGKLSNLSALVIGGFSEMKDTTVPYGQQVYDILNDIVKQYSYPVCFNFPVSHEKENYALKVGVEYTLKVTNKRVELKEI